ncbi:hypothetical protein BHE74_00053171 [Ensete ventricosum]|nr:hypothetical protein GW17_00006986 [Ensete ventricosum]RWW41343.1 hypothetical protein BHE74_00053171 [Ensete ventricosum]RZS14565.1 hypothetical protein BHM03_00046256 [Ensete ventricosum]
MSEESLAGDSFSPRREKDRSDKCLLIILGLLLVLLTGTLACHVLLHRNVTRPIPVLLRTGAMAFIKSISVEAVGLGVHLAAGAHEILLQTEYILTSIPMSVPLSDGFGRTASAILGTPLKSYQRGAGAGSAIGTAIRGAPAAAIAPFSASARAVHCTLLGLRNR